MREREVIVDAVDSLVAERDQFRDWWRIAEARVRKEIAERERIAAIAHADDEYLNEKIATAERRASEAEAKLATARVEGAREALTRYCSSELGVGHEQVVGECSWHLEHNCRVLWFRDREYPAPSSGEGRDAGVCDQCGHGMREHNDKGACWHFEGGKVCQCSPTPQAAPSSGEGGEAEPEVVGYAGTLGGTHATPITRTPQAAKWWWDNYETEVAVVNGRITITPDLARRIVALAQEGK